MTNNKKWIIHWENYVKNSYLYGTTLKFLENKEVYYKNALANTGITIKKWESQYNFQAAKSSIELPLLSNDNKYEIAVNANVIPEDSLYLRINFYDIYSELIEYKIIKNMKGIVSIPKNTFKYNIELFSAGLREMTFYNLAITEVNYTTESVNNNENLLVSDISNENTDFKILNINDYFKNINIIFQEQTINKIGELDNSIIALYKNVVIIKENNYLLVNNRKEFSIILEKFLADFPDYKLNFIGYNEATNKLAVYFATLFGGKAILSDIASNISTYTMDDYNNFANDFIKLYNDSSLVLIEDNIATINDEITRKLFSYEYRLKLISKDVI